MSSSSETIRRSLEKEFRKVISRFSVKDLKDSVPPAFEDEHFTWELMKKAILRYNLSTNKKDIVCLLMEYTKSMETDELQIIYGNLVLLELMLYSNKKTWISVNMKQQNQITKDNELVHNIKRVFLENKVKLNVLSNVSNNIRWFALFICKKERTNETALQRPIYIAHPLNTSFIFYSPKRTSDHFLKIFVKCLGYDSYKVMKLNGKCIKSLVSMLNRRKEADQVRVITSSALKNMSEVVAVKSARGVNFCQDKQRSKHAKAILGDETIQLETLTVNANSNWRGLRTVPEAVNEKFDVSMKISSKNIHASLEELIRKGVISPPYPEWLKECFISGKNDLQIG